MAIDLSIVGVVLVCCFKQAIFGCPQSFVYSKLCMTESG